MDPAKIHPAAALTPGMESFYQEFLTMKRRRTHFQLAILLTGLFAVSSSAFVQQQEGDSSEEGEGAIRDVPLTGIQPAEDPAEGVEKRGASTPEAGPSGFVARRRIAQLVKLQSAMKKKLDLTGNQKEAVDGLFKTYFRGLSEKEDRPRRLGADTGDGKALEGLREQLKEAKKAGDEDAVRQLRKQFRQERQTRTTGKALTLDQLFAKVAAELDEKQRQGFHRLTKRLRIGDVRQSRRGELRRLLRTVMNPDVGLSSEQQQTLRTVFRKGAIAIAQAQRGGGDSIDELTAQLRKDVLEELTPAQRVEVEAALRADAARNRNRKAAGIAKRPAEKDTLGVGAENGHQPPYEEPQQEDEPDNDDDR